MTNSWEKMVISSITQQLPIELSDDRNYAVTRTKHDPLLSSFNTSDSLSTRFVKLVSDSNILRSFLFLEANSTLEGLPDGAPLDIESLLYL